VGLAEVLDQSDTPVGYASIMWASSTVTARIVACCAATLALIGCGAGQITQTNSQVAAVDGSFGDIANSIALRNVRIPYPPTPQGTYPPGSAVPVLVTIINQSSATDELITVTSPAASRSLLLGSTRIPPGSTITSAAGPAGSEPTSPLVVGELRVVLLTNQVLHAGLNTSVTFEFRKAGKITLPVPMGPAPNSET
jgi:periplasmic copper chaperone A